MFESILMVIIFVVFAIAIVKIYSVNITVPRFVEKQSPQVTLDRLNYLYHNDYQDFQTVKSELEARGWKVIFIKNETMENG